jgi:hypothetical protein
LCGYLIFKFCVILAYTYSTPFLGVVWSLAYYFQFMWLDFCRFVWISVGLLDDSCAFVCTTIKANFISVVSKPILIGVKRKNRPTQNPVKKKILVGNIFLIN